MLVKNCDNSPFPQIDDIGSKYAMRMDDLGK
jgi:hypothetical protein